MFNTHNKALKQENLQLAVFTAFNILANYKFPLNEALSCSEDTREISTRNNIIYFQCNFGK